MYTLVFGYIYFSPTCSAPPDAGVFERRGRAVEGALGLVGFEEKVVCTHAGRAVSSFSHLYKDFSCFRGLTASKRRQLLQYLQVLPHRYRLTGLIIPVKKNL
jgi:hypothetical protein